MARQNKVLFLFEGETKENDVLKKIYEVYNKDYTNNVITLFAHNLYELYKEVIKDEYEDIIEIIRRRKSNLQGKNISVLDGLTRADFTQVYLFFDYDGHHNTATDEKVEEMLNLFNEETAKGKLYISYPMIEAILNNDKDNLEFCGIFCKVKAKENIKFKHLIASSSKLNIQHLNKSLSNVMFLNNLIKSNCIINNNPTLPSFKECTTFGQNIIFENQKNKFIIPMNEISILSCIPQYMIDNFGESFYNEIIKSP